MSTMESIKVRFADGTLREVRVKASADVPCTLEFQSTDGTVRRFEGPDLFEALRDMRAALESEGCQLLCAGARPDVAVSGMSRSMGSGRKGYIVQLGNPARQSDMVDIFDYAEPAVVGTVQQQRDYFQAWIKSLRPPT
jgi:hypothetical protein